MISSVFNSKYLTYSLLVGSALSFFSCDKQDNQPAPSNLTAQPVVVEGRLQFASLEQFGSYLTNMKDLPATNANSRKNFTSYYEVQQVSLSAPSGRVGGAIEEIRVSDTTYIPDSYLASVINQNREVAIGKDSVYKFGSDYTFVYLPQDTAYISQFYKDLQNHSVTVKENELVLYKNKIRVAKTQQSIISNEVVAATASGTSNGRIAGSIGGEAYFNDSERVAGEIWTSSWFFYSSCGAKTMGQRKVRKSFLWWSWDSWTDTNLNQLSFKFTGYGDQTITQYLNGVKVSFPTTPNGQGVYIVWEQPVAFNTSSTEKVFAKMYGFGVSKFLFTNVNSFHTGVQNGVWKNVHIQGNLW